jgi:2-isopropylmalate synthase
MTLQVQDGGAAVILHGTGTGPIDAAVRALGLPIDVVGYDEHSCGSGSDALAVAYVEVSTTSGAVFFGVGRHSNIITASLLALLSGVNRAFRAGVLARDPAVTTGT